MNMFSLLKQGRCLWMRAVVSTIALISIVVLVTACGADGTSAGTTPVTTTSTAVDDTTTSTTVNDTTTPTVTDDTTANTMVGATPTTSPASTPTATAATQTTGSKAGSNVAAGKTPAATAPKPTTPPTPTPTAKPVPTPTATPSPASSGGKTVTVWLQATDSCMEALPGAQFVVNGPGVTNSITGTTPGTLPAGVPTYVHGICPVDRGSCVSSLTGCVSVALNVPSSGTATYTITPKVIAGKQYLDGIVVLVPAQYRGQGAYSRNYSYVECEGGSDCAHGPEVATVKVSSNGTVAASTQNINPDGYKDKLWPSSGSFTGNRNDPIMFHLFGASAPDDFSLTCVDGGHGLRDHMTGYRWPHCNSGR